MITDLGERLALIIDAKTDGAVTNIRRLSAEEKAAADRADVLKAKLVDLEARAAKQAARPGGVSASTALQLGRTKSELAGLESTLTTVPGGAGAAEKALARLGLQGTVTGSALAKGLGGLAVGAALFGGFEVLKSGVDHYVALADQIRNVQYAAQGTAQDASKLVAITTALGVDSQTAALGVFRLGKNIELSPQKFSTYGIAIAHTAQGNTDLIGTLGNVAKAYQQTQDPAKKAAIVYEAFGRAGTSMLPILNANADKLKEIATEAAKQGRIFSAQDLTAAREYQITMRELADSFQALGIAAGRDLVPAIAKVANGLNDVTDIAAKLHIGTVIKDAAFMSTLGLSGFLFNGKSGGNAAQLAKMELAAQETAAQQKQLEQTAAATLGDASSILATPGQGLADAKQNLKDARQTLADAVTARNKAAKDLLTVRAGTPGADATALEASIARVHAAEARLRAAQYVGGDARVSGAQATLLSAQDHLNKLRGEGGVQTNKLATATERLHKADEAVAAAQRKERAAQQARNQATGFSAADIEKQLNAQLKDKTALAGAQGRLASLGATPELLAFLDKVNQGQAGTLVKVAKGVDAATVAKLNAVEDQVGAQRDLYSSIAGNPDAWRVAGETRGDKFKQGFAGAIGVGLSLLTGSPVNVGVPAPRPGSGKAASAVSGVFGSQVNVNGPVTVQAQDPAQFGRKMAAKRRLHSLSGPRPD